MDAYTINFLDTSKSLNPKAFKVPISILSSSIILVIVVEQMRDDTIKKKIEKTAAILLILFTEHL